MKILYPKIILSLCLNNQFNELNGKDEYIHNDERTLFSLIEKGDETAFRMVFDRYQKLFYGRAFRLSGSHYFAEEVVQEVFLRIWSKRSIIAEVENPEGYIFTMFYRVLYDRYRQEAIEKKNRSAVLEMPASEGLSREDMEVLEQRMEILQRALHQMPQQQATAYRLIKEEGLNREQVAEKMGLSPNTVRNHLAEAMRYLRKIARQIPIWVVICWNMYQFLKKMGS
jgi:RNA polymerase sigma-70 factor (ECF subfamily)